MPVWSSNVALSNPLVSMNTMLYDDALLLELFATSNPKIFESMRVRKEDNNELVVDFVCQHLFQDLGAPKVSGWVRMRRIDTGSDYVRAYKLVCVSSGVLEHIQSLGCTLSFNESGGARFAFEVDFAVPQGLSPAVINMGQHMLKAALKRTAIMIKNLSV